MAIAKAMQRLSCADGRPRGGYVPEIGKQALDEE